MTVPVVPAQQRAAQARELCETGAAVVVRDYTLPGRVRREAKCLPLASRAVGSRWWERPDVYWLTRLFSSQRSWVSGNDMGGPKRWRDLTGTIVLPGQPDDVYRRRYVRDPAALEAAAAGLAREPFVAMVSILRGAGRAIGAQVAALAGLHDSGDRGFLKAAAALAEAEVLEAAWHCAPGLPYPRTMAWQIKTGEPYRSWALAVAAAGAVASGFGCMPMMVGARADAGRRGNTRHQVLAVEAALRAMETGAAWIGWLPETACRPEWFLPEAHPARDRDLGIVADGCLVRSDGARVFLEIEASLSQRNGERFAQRVQRWSALFDDGDFGSVLLMLCAAPADQIGATIAEMRRAVEMHSTPNSRKFLLVGSWMDYSPDFGLVSSDQATLRAARYNGRGWQECHASFVEAPGAEYGIVSRLASMSFSPRWSLPQDLGQ